MKFKPLKANSKATTPPRRALVSPLASRITHDMRLALGEFLEMGVKFTIPDEVEIAIRDSAALYVLQMVEEGRADIVPDPTPEEAAAIYETRAGAAKLLLSALDSCPEDILPRVAAALERLGDQQAKLEQEPFLMPEKDSGER